MGEHSVLAWRKEMEKPVASRFRIVGIVVAVIVYHAGVISAQVWQSAGGPEGGEVMCLEQGANGVVWAGTYMGGLYRSDDTCRTWEYVETCFPGTVHAIAVLGDTVFAGTWGAGLWRSFDGGHSWTHVYPGLEHPPGAEVNQMRTVTVLGDVVWASAKTGFPIVSTDWGDTWEMRFQEMESIEFWRPAHYIKHQGFVYAASRSHGVARTADLGETWEKLNKGLPDYNRVRHITVFDSALIVGSYRGGGARFDSELLEWKEMNAGLCGDSIQVKALYGTSDSLFIASTCIGAGAASYQFHVRDDTSKEWEQIEIPGLYIWNQPDVLLQSGGILFAGTTGYGVRKIPTMDSYSKGLCSKLVLDLSVNESQSCVAAVSYYGQAFWGCGETQPNWREMTVGKGRLYAVDVCGDSMVVAGSDGVYLSVGFTDPDNLLDNYTSPKGWSGRGGLAIAVAMHGGHIFAEMDGCLQRYSFATKSWEIVQASTMGTHLEKFFFHESGWRLFVGRAGQLYYSDNVGEKWRSMLSQVYVNTMSGDERLLLAAGNETAIHLSFDNGDTWEEPRSTRMQGLSALAIKDGIVFAGHKGSGVFVSFDTTRTWYGINEGLRHTVVTSLALTDSMLYAGTKGTSVWQLPLSEIETLRRQTLGVGRSLPKPSRQFPDSPTDIAVYDLRGRLVQRNNGSFPLSGSDALYIIETVERKQKTIKIRVE